MLFRSEDRSIIISNLKSVDHVILYDEISVFDLVKFIVPDVLTKGGDYTIEQVVGHEIVQEAKGDVITIPVEKDRSTTNLIQKILTQL